MENCVFCKIVNHEIPCYRVYEDELVLAFLNINPVTDGHTLIIPKKHYENIFEIDNNTIERIASISKKIALKMKTNLDIDAINIFQSNGKDAEQEIMHYHMHLIPRKENDGFRINNCLCSKKVSNKKLEQILNKINI